VHVGVAFDLPEPWGSQLTARRAEAGDPAAEHIRAHVTLLTPREVPAALLPALERHLAAIAAGQHPIPLRLHGTGTFRPTNDVVYVAVVDGFAAAQQLSATINALPGLPSPVYQCHPHVTVAHNVDAAALDAVAADLADYTATFPLDRFSLFTHDGSGHWTHRQEFRLTA